MDFNNTERRHRCQYQALTISIQPTILRSSVKAETILCWQRMDNRPTPEKVHFLIKQPFLFAQRTTQSMATYLAFQTILWESNNRRHLACRATRQMTQKIVQVTDGQAPNSAKNKLLKSKILSRVSCNSSSSSYQMDTKR